MTKSKKKTVTTAINDDISNKQYDIELDPEELALRALCKKHIVQIVSLLKSESKQDDKTVKDYFSSLSLNERKRVWSMLLNHTSVALLGVSFIKRAHKVLGKLVLTTFTTDSASEPKTT